MSAKKTPPQSSGKKKTASSSLKKTDPEKRKKKELIENLSAQITHHQNLYYNSAPEIDDDAFDALWDRLREIAPDHKVLQRVGSDESFFPKKKHLMSMGSLDKANDEAQFMAWVREHPANSYAVQHKLDGAGLELQYRNGVLSAAVTRGNGITGDDILINARNMGGVPKRVQIRDTIAVRGEVIMTREVHAKHFSDKANCRNAANGLMKKKDGVGTRLLTVMCYDLWFLGKNNNSARLSESEKLDLLQNLGFTAVPHTMCADGEAICTYRNKIADTRAHLAYDIDGLVIKMPYADEADMRTLRPDRHIAFKFPLDTAVTTLRDVEWSESGHLYTPVAVLEPVRIAGTTVRRANLVHPDLIQELGLTIGSEVLVAKRGEIIPKVEALVHTPKNAPAIQLPTRCSTCGTAVESTGTRVFCPNLMCRRRLLFRVQRWMQINEIDFWGETLLNKLVLQKKRINRVGDLYRLSEDDLYSMERIGAPLAKKLIGSLHKQTEIDFERFFAAIGIENVALLTGEKLTAADIADWQTLAAANEEQLANIDGVGSIVAQAIVSTVALLRDELEDLLRCISIAPRKNTRPRALAGKSFCFTGAVARDGQAVARKELERMVKTAGGSVRTAVTKDLSYLVTADGNFTSGKSQKAKEYGVAIITPQDFFTLVSSR